MGEKHDLRPTNTRTTSASERRKKSWYSFTERQRTRLSLGSSDGSHCTQCSYFKDKIVITCKVIVFPERYHNRNAQACIQGKRNGQSPQTLDSSE